MGVTISCKKGNSIDMGYGGFLSLRVQIAKLAGEPWSSHYCKLVDAQMVFADQETKENFHNDFNAKTLKMIKNKKINVKIVDFCLQSDCEGSIHYGACKNILKIIGDYDDNICYGYCGRPNYATFKSFKNLLQQCVDNKCDLVWY